MEVILGAPQHECLPLDTFISMRIGDVQKQSRLAADVATGRFARTFKFPKPGDFRASFGRVEVYKRIGAMTVNFDGPDVGSQAVEVPCCLPDFPALQLELSVKGAQAPTAPTPEVADKMSRTKQRMDLAQQYLSENNLEELISDAMRELIRSRPTDPYAHLCQFIEQRKPPGFEKTKNPYVEHLVPPPVPCAQKFAPEPVAEPDVPKSTPALKLPEQPPTQDVATPKPELAPEQAMPVQASEPEAEPTLGDLWESCPQKAWDLMSCKFPGLSPPDLAAKEQPMPSVPAGEVAPAPAPVEPPKPVPLQPAKQSDVSSSIPAPDSLTKPEPASTQAAPPQEAKENAPVATAAPTLGDLWERCPQEAWDLMYSKFPGLSKPDLAAKEEPWPVVPMQMAVSVPAPVVKADPPPALLEKSADVPTPDSATALPIPPANLKPGLASEQAVLVQELKGNEPEVCPTLGDLWESCPQAAWNSLSATFPGSVKPDVDAKGEPMPSIPTLGEQWESCPQAAWDLLYSRCPGPIKPDMNAEGMTMPTVPSLADQWECCPQVAWDDLYSRFPGLTQPDLNSGGDLMPSVQGESSLPLGDQWESCPQAAWDSLYFRFPGHVRPDVNAKGERMPSVPSLGDQWDSCPQAAWDFLHRTFPGPTKPDLNAKGATMPSVPTLAEQWECCPQVAWDHLYSRFPGPVKPDLGAMRPGAMLAASVESWDAASGEVRKEYVTQLQSLVNEKDKEIERLKAMLEDFERMKASMA